VLAECKVEMGSVREKERARVCRIQYGKCGRPLHGEMAGKPPPPTQPMA